MSRIIAFLFSLMIAFPAWAGDVNLDLIVAAYNGNAVMVNLPVYPQALGLQREILL